MSNFKHYTCNEFNIVKIHANTAVSSLIASNPNTQVHPRMGRIITAVLINDLEINGKIKTHSSGPGSRCTPHHEYILTGGTIA